jgi:hypothetical protein
MRGRTLLCQRTNFWPLTRGCDAPILTGMTWRLVIYSCFREWNRNCYGVASRMCRIIKNCWLPYKRFQKFNFSGDGNRGKNIAPLAYARMGTAKTNQKIHGCISLSTRSGSFRKRVIILRYVMLRYVILHYIILYYMYYIICIIYKTCPSESGPEVGVSIVSWTNGTLVSTNKVIMCRQYVLHRYCHLCTTLQFVIYTCI